MPALTQVEVAIDKSPAAIGKRRAAATSELGSFALEGLLFDEQEMAIINRYIDGEIDSEVMRLQLLALPTR